LKEDNKNISESCFKKDNEINYRRKENEKLSLIHYELEVKIKDAEKEKNNIKEENIKMTKEKDNEMRKIQNENNNIKKNIIKINKDIDDKTIIIKEKDNLITRKLEKEKKYIRLISQIKNDYINFCLINKEIINSSKIYYNELNNVVVDIKK